MSGVVETEATLMGQFSDALPPGAIAPAYMRDFIATMFSLTLLPFTTQTTNYTLQASDVGTVVEYYGTTGASFTIPLSSSVNWTVGQIIFVAQMVSLPNGETLNIVGATNAISTDSPPGSLNAARTYGSLLMLRYRGNNTWHLTGDLQ